MCRQPGNVSSEEIQIMESLRQEETLGGLSSYLLPKAGYDKNSNQAVRALISLCLENFQGPVIFIVIFFFFFLIATLNVSPFQFKVTTSCFSASLLCEGPGSISLLASLWVLGAAAGSLSTCLCSRLNKLHSITLSSPYKCSKWN